MDDRARVEALLGRPPRGPFDVVARDDMGDPLVIRNAPFLDDGTPMPTRYYLVGADLVREVSRLEAAGGVRRAEVEVDPAALVATHRRYAEERDAEIPADHEGPRPSGGVGGTREGVKCLHAHVAHALGGGDDPVGRWALQQLGRPVEHQLQLEIDDAELTVRSGGRAALPLPIGPRPLFEEFLAASDPPAPEQLTNALGAVTDHLDDAFIEAPELLETAGLTVGGRHALVLAQVELGLDEVPAGYRLRRADVDEVFRTLAGEARDDRLANPGLPPADVDTIVPTCCIVLAAMRRLDLPGAALRVRPDDRRAREGSTWH